MFNELLNSTANQKRTSSDLLNKVFNSFLVRITDNDGAVVDESYLQDLYIDVTLRGDKTVNLVSNLNLWEILMMSNYFGGQAHNFDNDVFSGILPLGTIPLLENDVLEIVLKNEGTLSSDVDIEIYTVDSSLSNSEIYKYEGINGGSKRNAFPCIAVYTAETFSNDVKLDYETGSDSVTFNQANSFGLATGDIQDEQNFGVIFEDSSVGDYGQKVSMDLPDSRFIIVSKVYDSERIGARENSIRARNENIFNAVRRNSQDAAEIL